MRLNDVRILLLGLTNRCNGKCIMCWHSNSKPYGRCDLPLHIYEGVRDKLFNKIKLLNLAGGGEILMYPHIDQVLEDIKRSRFKTSITSNFSEMPDSYRKKLGELNVEFVVSMDGSTKKLQEHLRPSCKYESVIDNIEYFKARKKRIMIQCTVSYQNFYDIGNMIDLANRLKVDVIKFHNVIFPDNLERPYKVKRPPEDKKYLNSVLNQKTKTKVCAYLGYYHKPLLSVPTSLNKLYQLFRTESKMCCNTLDTLKIQENGQVLSCCVPYSKVMGDLYKNTIEEIIGSEAFDKNRINCKCPLRR